MADGCDGMTLGAGASCTIMIHFTPGSTGAKTAVLTVTASPGGSSAVSLSGTGT